MRHAERARCVRGCAKYLLAGALIAPTVTPAAGAAPGGGVFSSFPPAIGAVRCQRSCIALDAVRPGGTVRITGASLSGAVRVSFLGSGSRGHAVSARPELVRPDHLDVLVPAGASSGRLQVINADGLKSKPSRAVLTVNRSTAVGDRHGRGAIDARLASKRVFVGGRQGARLDYLLTGSRPEDVRVDLASVKSGDVVASWSPGVVAAQQPRTVIWSGISRGRAAASGAYQFRVYVGPSAASSRVAGGAQAGTQDVAPASADSFTLLGHIFPIRGAHSYGSGGGRFGAGRAGHSHQGQDVFATCGTPLVAARSGAIKHRAFQSLAGNYVVIDQDGSDNDLMYAHMREPALAALGDHVYTGQLIGYVGDTGDAQGCHLHMEMWSAPGWYSGGAPFDPLRSLKVWDRDS